MQRKASLALLVVLLIAFVLSCVGSCQRDAEQGLSVWTGSLKVRTLYGWVKGQMFEDVLAWKGIPYARPPVDDLRWKAPRDPDVWKGTLQAKNFCQPCSQLNLDGSPMGSEDCLYLNIWRPQSRDRLPVYFWIHGGGNSMGAASNEGYDGANLARQGNMVVITVNYRLGPLGWFTHSALRSSGARADPDDSGNYGTLDLIKALIWVRDNIAAFGGNPDRVTVAGESAGAINIFSLLISPLAKGLFHGAIAQSGVPIATPVDEGERSAEEVILKLLITDGIAADNASARARFNQMSAAEINAYLRSKTPAQLLSTYPRLGLGMISFPFIFKDGVVIPGEGFDILSTGDYSNKVPIIIGSTLEETKLFLYFAGLYGSTTFPALKDSVLYEKIASYTSDLWKARGVDEVARTLSSHQDQPNIYVYQFLWGKTGAEGKSVIPGELGVKLGACHGLDVAFFFGNWNFFSLLSPLVFTEGNRAGREALSAAIMTYVGQFVWTGDPSPDGNPPVDWVPWVNTPGELKCLLLDADLQSASIAMSSAEITEAEAMARIDDELRTLIRSMSGRIPLLID